MMKAILIAAHGSRQKSTERTLAAVASMAQQILQSEGQKFPTLFAFMEFGTPTIPDALEVLALKGATHIIVAPYFLFDGIHIREDIPALLAAFQASHPSVTVTLAPPLGEDVRLAEVLVERIRSIQ